jgi:NADH-quinone oxidoreductase subunit L
MFLLYYTFKSLDFSIIFALVPYLIIDTISIFSIEINTLNLIGILLLIGCAGKSAQIGLHT